MALRKAVLAGSLLLAAGCFTPAPIQYMAGTTPDGLQRVRDEQLGARFVRPGAELSYYRAVLIDPLSVRYAPEPERSYRGPGRPRVALTADEIERLKKIYHDSLESSFGGFEQVAAPAHDVLRVSGHVVDLEVEIPPYRGGEMQFVVAMGAMTMVLDVRDSTTDEAMTRIVDRRAVRPDTVSLVAGFDSTPVNYWGAIRELMAKWARSIRTSVEGMRVAPAPPLPGAATT